MHISVHIRYVTFTFQIFSYLFLITKGKHVVYNSLKWFCSVFYKLKYSFYCHKIIYLILWRVYIISQLVVPSFEIRGSHGSEDVDAGCQGCEAMWSYRPLQTPEGTASQARSQLPRIHSLYFVDFRTQGRYHIEASWISCGGGKIFLCVIKVCISQATLILVV
jgi:hypothetical protein